MSSIRLAEPVRSERHPRGRGCAIPNRASGGSGTSPSLACGAAPRSRDGAKHRVGAGDAVVKPVGNRMRAVIARPVQPAATSGERDPGIEVITISTHCARVRPPCPRLDETGQAMRKETALGAERAAAQSGAVTRPRESSARCGCLTIAPSPQSSKRTGGATRDHAAWTQLKLSRSSSSTRRMPLSSHRSVPRTGAPGAELRERRPPRPTSDDNVAGNSSVTPQAGELDAIIVG